MNTLRKDIEAVLQNRYICRIYRKGEGEEELYRIIGFNEKFILASNYYDFRFDGFIIIMTDDLINLICDETTRFFDKILAAENIMPPITSICMNDLDSFEKIFEKLKSEYLYVMIESESFYYFGKIENINNCSVEILCYDSEGNFDKTATSVNFKDISAISFGCKYVEITSKYVKWV